MNVQFISYNKRAKKPKSISTSGIVYELFNAHTLWFEDEARFICDTHVGIRVPVGYVAEVIPNPPIFWYTDLSIQGGSYFIEPGMIDSIKLFLIPIFDIANLIPAEGDSIALIKLSPAQPFDVEWTGPEPERELIDMSNIN